MNIAETLAEVAKVIESATWAPFPDDGLHEHDTTARAFQGKSADGGWFFLVVTFAGRCHECHETEHARTCSERVHTEACADASARYIGHEPEPCCCPADWKSESGRGYDGTATCASRGLVMRLPRELAERCFKLATKGATP